ncbi:putative manganese-dependent inorganic diphosphatase [Dorea formicigenerans]|jgi:manganese-dependent inorganic pyrophosphatase|uniref:inorganic diphosphatase n=1 Tax=Dorea formicigenerans TaxID=39486 RepID=A0A3E4MMP7_9FIRM|nr:putative manganese-dependent inorganic diphosphatase [Dorea formicigenerans]RGI84890.1 putative manganese-dependent inorganic diphosphatase [Dorea formicigenerans]RGI88601.1 putative manganese-dependent inorganic diphosphatase [Dorea formicigenerans]RGK50764.1 putative manganese-dependent inorganic diphosphatase [Dorea formicigenerans]RGO52054.1 putative manganese-dependent inorganic diphosphatase [Dorea formicigenerans]RGT08082.1 putative manganese-dependent inorganic diphosphatase [Dorea 
MGKRKEKIYVIGHKNPDTDSICSAIAYADLRQKVTGQVHEAKRAGHVNDETAYVLDRFGVEAPKLLTDVRLQVRDLDIHEMQGLKPNASIRDTWERMRQEQAKTLPIVKDDELVGVVSTGDIAKSYMDVYDSEILSKARTQYRNIVKTLDGTMITGNEHGYFMRGKVAIGASSPNLMEEFIEKDDLVILGDREEAQACAVNIDASCMVICKDAEVSPKLIQKAKEQSIVIIQTPYDTFTTARLINQSIPVKFYMTSGPLTMFRMNDYVDDIKDIMAKKRFRDFPILDRHGRFKGFISRRRFLGASKKKVILVDHNERSQAVDGIEEAEIIEIIDHHRLGDIETVSPITFRNQPVGCTATIINQMYEENEIEVPREIAGLLCGAIISDTLLFRSPTCTPLDERTAKKLAKISDIDLEQMAQEMFNAGSNLKGKSAEDICFQDFKQFTVNDTIFGVGQITSMSKEELAAIRDMMTEHLPKVLEAHNLNMIYFMLTDILAESTELLCVGTGARGIALSAFDLPDNAKSLILKGVVSRKKQLIPVLVETMQQM